MSRLNNNLITLFLVIVLISNIFIFLFPGPQKAEASFINEYKDGIFTAVKGLAMLWILNLIIQKGGDSETEEDNIITSLINGESEESEESKENEESEDREDRENVEGPEKGNKKQEAENSGVEI
ncbi:MAG: hypothetical protein ACOC2O_01720, partial [Bacillota bacterium]